MCEYVGVCAYACVYVCVCVCECIYALCAPAVSGSIIFCVFVARDGDTLLGERTVTGMVIHYWARGRLQEDGNTLLGEREVTAVW